MTAAPVSIAFLDSLGGPELLLILVVVLIFFGGEKMPEFARGLGKAIREFKKAAGEVESEFKKAMDDVPEKPASERLRAISPPSAPTVPITPPPAHPRAIEPTGEPPKSDHGIDA